MKALLYKEFKLAMHPVCYAFIFLFPLMILIPKFPTAVGYIYVLSSYPILFLGANKGQQSNDLLYSTLMPVRKKDIVIARIEVGGGIHNGIILGESRREARHAPACGSLKIHALQLFGRNLVN